MINCARLVFRGCACPAFAGIEGGEFEERLPKVAFSNLGLIDGTAYGVLNQRLRQKQP
jgi:hypothetical protein